MFAQTETQYTLNLWDELIENRIDLSVFHFSNKRVGMPEPGSIYDKEYIDTSLPLAILIDGSSSIKRKSDEGLKKSSIWKIIQYDTCAHSVFRGLSCI